MWTTGLDDTYTYVGARDEKARVDVRPADAANRAHVQFPIAYVGVLHHVLQGTRQHTDLSVHRGGFDATSNGELLRTGRKTPECQDSASRPAR